jgi:hypothetical protein
MKWSNASGILRRLKTSVQYKGTEGKEMILRYLGILFQVNVELLTAQKKMFTGFS